MQAAASRKALAGFFVSGLLFGLPGAILPAWGYHLRPNHSSIGNYFLAVNAGLLLSIRIAHWILASRGSSALAGVGCAVAFCALVALSRTSPPVGEIWRVPGFLVLGAGAGMLNTALFNAISRIYRHDSAAAVNLAGVFFGLGSLASAVAVATMFNLYTVGSTLFLIALIPGFFAIFFLRKRLAPEPALRQRPWRDVAHEFTLPSAVLFSLLLFFHFGNEWAIAGWLPIFLIQRLGLSPVGALSVLACYWLALLVGRLLAQTILSRVNHGKFLMVSVLAAFFGCIVLTLTDNVFGAVLGILFIGMGFAPIYPLVVEKIGTRFPHYHPGFFNGIFSIALTGGMLAPASLGYAAEFMGIRVVMLLPAIGTFIVFLLVLAIWFEAKVSGPSPKAEHGVTRQ